MEIDGERALVLGGTSGIGLAAVRMLEAAGAKVVAGGRSAERLESAQAEVGATVRFMQVDVLDRDALATVFTEEGPFDILINSAVPAGREVGPFPRMNLDGFQRTFDKFWGYLNSVRIGLEHLSPEAAIVLVSGFPARKCPPGMSAISTVGNAVEGFVRAIVDGDVGPVLPRELVQEGLRMRHGFHAGTGYFHFWAWGQRGFCRRIDILT